MGLFDLFKKKPAVVSTVLTGSTSKSAQDNLKNLQQYGDPIKSYIDLNNEGSIILTFGKTNEKLVGRLPAKAAKPIIDSIEDDSKDSGKIVVHSYRVFTDKNDKLACEVTYHVEYN